MSKHQTPKRRATTDWSDLRAAKNQMARRLIHEPRVLEAHRQLASRMVMPRILSLPVSPAPSENTVGVGIGEKISDGKQTGILAHHR